MIHTESELIAELNVILANLDTGPLSDTPYSDTSVNGDQQLELWEEPNTGWPSASVDTPQLARAILEKRKGTLAALDGAPEPETAPENYEPKCNCEHVKRHTSPPLPVDGEKP